MKAFKTQHLPLFTLIAGILGFLLQVLLKKTGMDEKNLLVSNHIAGILLYILTAVVLVMLLIAIRPLRNTNRYSSLFPASAASFIGCILGAVGILISGIVKVLAQHDLITVMAAVLAAASAVCLVLLGLCRKKGTQPNFLLHACLTVHLMFQLIAQYRHWSPEPQLLMYFFPLLASVFLMITTYQATCLDAQKGSRRWYVFFNQAAVFFCFVSLFSDYWLFYLAMGIWAHTNLCSLHISKHRSGERKEA